MRLLLTVVRSEGITALVATHDAGLVDLADEVVTLEDGRSGPDPALIGSLPRRQWRAARSRAATRRAATGGRPPGGRPPGGPPGPAGRQDPGPAPAARHRRSQPAPVSTWWKRRENK